jgi:hypothetical protein
MKRKDALNAIMYAGYHEDTRTGTRLFIENRISFEVYNAKFNEGRQRKRNGQRCGCSECSPPPTAQEPK